MYGQKRGSREQRNPEVVYGKAETDLKEGDSEIHGIPCEAVRAFHDELGRRLPGSGILACAHEKNAGRGDEAQADHENKNTSRDAARPVDRYWRRRYSVLKNH